MSSELSIMIKNFKKQEAEYERRIMQLKKSCNYLHDLSMTNKSTIAELENIIRELEIQMDYISDNSFNKVRALKKEIEDMKTTGHSSTKEFKWNEKCSVCLAEFKQDDKLVITNCNHLFHETCLSQSLQVKSSCPLCRCDI